MTGDPRAIAAALAAAVVCAGIGVVVVWNDQPAISVGAAIRPPTPRPGPPVPQRQVEEAPPVRDTVPGDGTWYIGKEIKRGTYRTTGSEICLWERLGDGLVVITGAFRGGPQTVALGKDDVAFTTQGCPVWELVR